MFQGISVGSSLFLFILQVAQVWRSEFGCSLNVPVDEYTAVSLPRGFQSVCVRIWKSKLSSKSVYGWVCILFSLEYKV